MVDCYKEKNPLQAIVESINKCNGPLLVVSHVQPDGDALGATLGLGLALREAGKEVTLVSASPIDSRYTFLPSLSEIKENFKADSSALSVFESVVVLDCGDLKRVGDDLCAALQSHPSVINIDHHISNDFFGKLVFIDSEASSTCQILCECIEQLEIITEKKLFTSSVATCLLAGMVSDTAAFRYQSTTPRTLTWAQHLMTHGANLSSLCISLFSSARLSSVRLRGLVLSQCEVKDGIALGVVTEDLYAQSGSTAEDTEGLAEELRSIEGVQVAVVIRKDSPLWRVSLRGKDARLDLSTIAAQFGGGGHRLAAAFRSRKSPEEFKKPLMEFIRIQVEQLALTSS